MSNHRCDFKECLEISDSERILCKGDCQLSFHVKCIGLKKTVLAVLKENANIHWHCYDCSASSINNASKSMTDCTRAVTELISNISPMIEFITANVSNCNIGNSASYRATDCESEMETDSNANGPTVKRKRVFTQTRLLRSNVVNNRNQMNQALQFGTNDMESHLKLFTSFKNVYISHLDPTTTEEDIMKYIKERINVSDLSNVLCKKLVPVGKNLKDLQFISFKVS